MLVLMHGWMDGVMQLRKVVAYLSGRRNTISNGVFAALTASRNSSRGSSLLLHWTMKKYRISIFLVFCSRVCAWDAGVEVNGRSHCATAIMTEFRQHNIHAERKIGIRKAGMGFKR